MRKWVILVGMILFTIGYSTNMWFAMVELDYTLMKQDTEAYESTGNIVGRNISDQSYSKLVILESDTDYQLSVSSETPGMEVLFPNGNVEHSKPCDFLDEIDYCVEIEGNWSYVEVSESGGKLYVLASTLDDSDMTMRVGRTWLYSSESLREIEVTFQAKLAVGVFLFIMLWLFLLAYLPKNKSKIDSTENGKVS